MMLAQNIQFLRKKSGWSQEELAEKCKVSRQAIAKWENGESVPAIDKLIFLADLYDVSLDELVGRVMVDQYAKVKQYIKEYAAKDIPVSEDDDLSAIIVRYLSFAERMGLTAEQRMIGLEEIFLSNVD